MNTTFWVWIWGILAFLSVIAAILFNDVHTYYLLRKKLKK